MWAKWTAWLLLVERLMSITLSNDTNVLRWKLTTSDVFSVKSMYENFMNGHTR